MSMTSGLFDSSKHMVRKDTYRIRDLVKEGRMDILPLLLEVE